MLLRSVALRFLRQFLNWPAYVALRKDVRSATYASLASYCETAFIPVYTRSKNGSRTVLRVDVNADGSVPNRTT